MDDDKLFQDLSRLADDIEREVVKTEMNTRAAFKQVEDQAAKMVQEAKEAFSGIFGQIDVMRDQAQTFRRKAVRHLDPDRAEKDMERSCRSKRRYRSPEAAGSAAQSIHKYRTVDLRIYRCVWCDFYHLTHKDLLEVVEGRERADS